MAEGVRAAGFEPVAFSAKGDLEVADDVVGLPRSLAAHCVVGPAYAAATHVVELFDTLP